MPQLEAVVLVPAEGTFPVEQIAEHLDEQPFGFRDPGSDPPMFLLCGNAGATQFSRNQVLTRPEEPYPPVALIRVSPEAIHVSHQCAADALRQGREFVAWMHANYRCRIFDTEGTEYTDRVKDSIDLLYE